MDSSKCINPETYPFRVPQRAVSSVDSMEIWLKSEAYFEYIGFITAMNKEVRGKPLSVPCTESEVTIGMLSLLEKLDMWITEIPPIQQPQRFGNKAFKTWYTKVKENALELLQEALPAKFHRAVPEIKEYFTESFGNSTRIDYGTGHEMSFCMFLCCLFKIGAFTAADNLAVVCKVFNRYMIFIRRLQTVYKMEPAGSRGVWALDDYQFIPFIWGSSQLIDHPRIEPRSFLQPDIVNIFAKDYMFLGCIKYINEVKTGPFAEHSNQLWNISGVGYWGKVNEGLIKMYKAEVLAKFPVVQHVLFGSLLPLVVAPLPPTSLLGKRPPGRLSRESITRPPPPGGFGRPDDKTATISSFTSEKPEDRTVTVASTVADKLEERTVTVASTIADKPEERTVTVASAIVDKPENKIVTVVSATADKPGDKTVTVVSATADKPGDKTVTVASATAEKTVTIASTITDKPEDKTVTVASATADKLVDKTVTVASATADKLVDKTVTVASATADKTVTIASTISDKPEDKTVTVTSATADKLVDKTVTVASAIADKPGDKTVTVASATADKTVTIASTITDKPENKTVTVASATADKPEDKTITFVSATTEKQGNETVTVTSATAENLEDKNTLRTTREKSEDTNIGNRSNVSIQTHTSTTTVPKNTPSPSPSNVT